jgi:sulfur-carrier protein
MQIQVRFFASIREAVGTSVLALDTQASTVGALRDELIARGSEWADALTRSKAVRAALNQVMVNDAAVLSPACEVAFFPPVTGG